MYPSDISDVQWERISQFFSRPDPRGARLKHPRRSIVNAILYVTKGGCQWRMLPKDFPPWKTVYDHFRKWCMRGIWEQVLDALIRETRVKAGKAPCPTYGIIDSQSVKTQYDSDDRGIHGGKKSKGTQPAHRHRHDGEPVARLRSRRQPP
jgi:putative transposase